MPSISYCCIFKNEEKHLPKWIECAKQVASEEGDEIIACDTGSTDKSCELLREAGIEPIYFEWINDFSAAKNFVIDQAKGDWILFMDCDEYFSKETLPFVRAAITEAEKKNIMIIQSNMHNIDEDNNDRLISTCYHWRIFKNDPLLRYNKAIHEFIKYFGEGQATVIKSDLLILHTGYSATLARLKGARNLEFLEADIANNETDEITTQQAYYMANTYAQLGDMNKAAEYADIAAQGSDEELGFMTVKMYKDLLQREEMKEGGGDYDTKLAIVDEALTRGQDQPDFLIDKIRLYLQKEYYYAVERMCYKTLEKMQDPVIMQRFESNAPVLLFYVYNVLSNMKFHRGEVIEARRFAFMALSENPRDRAILENFVKCFRYETLAIVKPIMDRVYPNPTKENKEMFKELYKATNYGDVYLHYVKPKLNTFEYNMCKGHYKKALKICEKELLELFKIAAFARANFPNETQILNAAVPPKYLSGAQKRPKGDNFTLQDLMNKFIEVFSKIIMACFSMKDEEFERNKSILNYLVSPAKDFLLAGFNQATQGVQQFDTDKFYRNIVSHANKDCLTRLCKVVYMMPVDDNFIYGVLKDLIVFKDLQNAYNLTGKIQNKDRNYWLVLGVILLYAGEKQKARESFIKARQLGAYTIELRDFIKMTDPAEAVTCSL